jgi:hypothetical protein
MTKTIKDFLFVMFRPAYWLSHKPTCKHLDAWLNHQMDIGADVKADNYIAHIGDKMLWIGSYPYSYGGEIIGISLNSQWLPANRTRKRLRDYIAKRQYEITTAKVIQGKFKVVK